MKSNKIFLLIFVSSVLLLAGLMWLGKPTGKNAVQDSASAQKLSASAAMLIADPNSFDFGTISMAKGSVRYTFALKNTSTDSMTAKKLYTSCMCTKASITVRGDTKGPFGMPGHGFVPSINERIEPAEEVAIEAVFDPAAHGPAGVGRIERSVYLELDSGEEIELRVSAVVTP